MKEPIKIREYNILLPLHEGQLDPVLWIAGDSIPQDMQGLKHFLRRLAKVMRLAQVSACIVTKVLPAGLGMLLKRTNEKRELRPRGRGS